MVSEALKAWESSGKYIRVGSFGHKIFVREMGKTDAKAEKTLLLLHGFPESSFTYHAVEDRLLEVFDRIILFDFPGFGWSDKPLTNYTYSLFEHADIAFAVWNHFGVEGGHLLAHDMGVSVATEIMARSEAQLLPAWFSEGLKSLTLTNGSLVMEFAKLRITQKLLLSRFGSFFNRLFIVYGLFKNQIRSAHGNANLSEQEIQCLWEANTLQEGHRKVYLTVRYNLERRRFEKARWLPALAQTRIPIHLCWGDQDQVAKVVMAQYLKEKVCPDAQLTVMKGLGHFGQLGSPEKWVQAVCGFYEGKV